MNKHEITKQEFEAILKLPPDKRYQYFIKRICDWEQIYALYEGNSIILNEDKKGNLFVFLFPFETFASHYAQNTDEFESSICKAIELDKFIEEVIEKLLSHNVLNALVFPVPNGYGLNVSLSQLKEDINQELENY
jgi:hypothetical protein